MSRKHQYAVLLSITVGSVAFGFYVVCFRRDANMFFMLVALYVGFVGLFSVWSYYTVPARFRKRPLMPPDFRLIRIGEVSDAVSPLLGSARTLKTYSANGNVSRLLEIQREFDEGRWICQLEELDGKVLAYSITFESRFTPTLDRGESHGSGVFFPSSS